MLLSMAIKEDSLAIMAYILFLTLLFLSSSCKSADDHLTHSKPLTLDDMLISDGGDFALGFLSPPSSSNKSLLYLCIWYHSIPGRTVVWIANRDKPIIEATPSSPKLVITKTPTLCYQTPKAMQFGRRRTTSPTPTPEPEPEPEPERTRCC